MKPSTFPPARRLPILLTTTITPRVQTGSPGQPPLPVSADLPPNLMKPTTNTNNNSATDHRDMLGQRLRQSFHAADLGGVYKRQRPIPPPVFVAVVREALRSTRRSFTYYLATGPRFFQPIR